MILTCLTLNHLGFLQFRGILPPLFPLSACWLDHLTRFLKPHAHTALHTHMHANTERLKRMRHVQNWRALRWGLPFRQASQEALSSADCDRGGEGVCFPLVGNAGRGGVTRLERQFKAEQVSRERRGDKHRQSLCYELTLFFVLLGVLLEGEDSAY